jgi:hypothetical protein
MREGRSVLRSEESIKVHRQLLLKTRFRRQRIQRPNPRKRRSARAWKRAGITRRVEYTPTHADDLLFVPEGRSARRRHARAHIAYLRSILLNSSEHHADQENTQ